MGHTPTTLYREDYPCADPVWDRKKKILSIDGGCGIKPDGQLNCVIFPSWGEERMEYTFYDGLRPVTALMPQEESAVSRNLHWGHHRVQLLEEGEEFARCRQLETGYEMDIPSGYLYTRGGVLFSQDITDYRPAVEPGDTLKVVMETSRGLLCKKGSVTGWYLGEYEPKDE